MRTFFVFVFLVLSWSAVAFLTSSPSLRRGSQLQVGLKIPGFNAPVFNSSATTSSPTPPEKPQRKTKKLSDYQKPLFGIVTAGYLDLRIDERFEELTKNLDKKFQDLDKKFQDLDNKLFFVALVPAIVPAFVMYLIEHEKAVKVMAEAALFEKKYQAVSEVLLPALSVAKDLVK